MSRVITSARCIESSLDETSYNHLCGIYSPVQCLHSDPCEPQVKCSFTGTTENTNSQILRLSLPPSLSQTLSSPSQLIRGAPSSTAPLSPAPKANQDTRWRLYVTRAACDWLRGPGSAGQWPSAVVRSLCLLPSAWPNRKSETPVSKLVQTWDYGS